MKLSKNLIKNISLIILIINLSLSKSKFFNDNYTTKKNLNSTKSYSIYYLSENDSFEIKENLYDDKNAVAFCKFSNNLNITGWNTLAISSYQGKDKKFTDEIKARAMGFLEGAITYNQIWDSYRNQKFYFYQNNPNTEIKGEMPEITRKFLQENFEYVLENSKKYKDNDPYWQHAFLIHLQFSGLLEGYNKYSQKDQQLNLADLSILNAMGDIEDIENYSKKNRANFDKMSTKEIANYFEDKSHCSSLIKIAPDFSDVWFGHNTWTTFSSMNRVFKEYKFTSNDLTEKSKTVAFSSYFGSLSSIDDFYILDTDLYVTETTNPVLNMDLFDKISPRSLLTWQRTIIANRLSDNGKQWTEIFVQNNSGTYNNQFQILDMKLIDTESKQIFPNAFWIIEQIPGFTEAKDMTDILKYGYWPSYNAAYFPKIRTLSGYDEQLKNHPDLRDRLDYFGCVRANIFRRDQGNIKDIDGYKKLIRYNDFMNDPFSKKDAGYAIACRRDLDKDDKWVTCQGATDSKMASINDVKGKKSKVIRIINGPTNDQQPSFDWKNAKCLAKGNFVFHGLPEKFDFTWIDYVTELFD